MEEYNTIETKCGTIYIEKFEPENREEEDRIKLYDSDKRYLDYISAKRYNTEEKYKKKIEVLKKMDEPVIRAFLTDKMEYVGTKEELIDYLRDELCWENTEEEMLENEYVNRIGETYILWED